MKYLCLGYHDEQAWNEMPAGERDALLAETLAYGDLLRIGGHVIHEQALQGAGNAATLRFVKGVMTVTDGPFSETKEQLGGVMVLEANDLSQAIQLMEKILCMRIGGAMEIRPVNEELNEAIAARAVAAKR